MENPDINLIANSCYNAIALLYPNTLTEVRRHSTLKFLYSYFEDAYDAGFKHGVAEDSKDH